MQTFHVRFAGHGVLVRYQGEVIRTFLTLLFADMEEMAAAAPAARMLEIAATPGVGDAQLELIDNGHIYMRGTLGVAFAAALFDRVLFHLLDNNGDGVALHAAAVAHHRQVILLPGQSGAGKTTFAAWLMSRGLSYLTDELVLLPSADPCRMLAFTRPLNIKSGSRAVVQALLLHNEQGCVLEDEHGLIVPHRAINPHFRPVASTPSLVLFPEFRPDVRPRVERVSRAQAGGYLMACDVNGRNLADHGFKQLMGVARNAPAYRVVFSSFDGVWELIAPLLQEERLAC